MTSLWLSTETVKADFASGHLFSGLIRGGPGDRVASIIEFDSSGAFVAEYDITDQMPAGIGDVEAFVAPLEMTATGTLLCRTGFMPGAGWFEMDSEGTVVRFYPAEPSYYSGSYGPYGATVGADGLIYGMHYQPYSGGSMRVFDPESATYATPIRSWVVDEGSWPATVGGRLFGGSWANYQLREFGVDGSVVHEWGRFGSVYTLLSNDAGDFVVAGVQSPWNGLDGYRSFNINVGTTPEVVYNTPQSFFTHVGIALDQSNLLLIAQRLAGTNDALVSVYEIGNGEPIASLTIEWPGDGMTYGLAVSGAYPTNEPPTCAVDLTQADLYFYKPDPELASYVVTEGETINVVFTGEDPDGDDLTAWLCGLPGSASLSPTGGPAPLVADFEWTPTAADKAGAPYTVEVVFEDPYGETTACGFTIEDINLRPMAIVGGPITVEADGPSGSVVPLNGAGSFDPEGDALIYTWEVSDLSVILDDPSSPTPSGEFPIGVTMATLIVADGRGGVDTADVVVTVEDTTPPELSCTTDVASLWPPKHQLREVTVFLVVSDACTSPEDIILLSVTVRSDEPDDAIGSGDGATTGDVDGQDGFNDCVDITDRLTFDENLGTNGAWVGTIQLRAERDGAGDGRAYVIDVEALDSALNLATASCCVVVPHDRRGGAN